MVIGTHSLIAEGVEFSSLRIAVVDEQHRFGVIQRGRFNSKVILNPHFINVICLSYINILRRLFTCLRLVCSCFRLLY